MLNRVTAILLLAALLTANFSRFFVYAGYVLNKKYIATQLCENRNKPWLHCDGKCYFMNKIKQVQEKEKNEERQVQKNLFQEDFLITNTTIKFHQHLLQVINTPYLGSYPITFKGTLFQPPKQV